MSKTVNEIHNIFRLVLSVGVLYIVLESSEFHFDYDKYLTNVEKMIV